MNDYATYVLNELVNLEHTLFAALGIPRHVFEVRVFLIFFASVRSNVLCV